MSRNAASSVRLPCSVAALASPGFKTVLKQEIEALGALQLPLQEGLQTGSYVLDEPVEAMILNVSETQTELRIKAGILFKSVIAGCACTDDPSPVDARNEYCELRLSIDKSTAGTFIEPVN